MSTKIVFAIVAAVLALALIAAPSLVSEVLAKPPKMTTSTSTTEEPVNGGLTETTTTTTTTTCANGGGQGPQAANCPGPHESTTSSSTCDVTNKPGKEPGGHNPC
jgi:hypothetical protein